MSGCAFGCEVSIVFEEPAISKVEVLDGNEIVVLDINIMVQVCSVCAQAWVDKETHQMLLDAPCKYLESKYGPSENKDPNNG